jgi:hypothetical protein
MFDLRRATADDCLLAAAESFEPGARLVVKAVADAPSAPALFVVPVRLRRKLGEEEPRRELAHLLPRDAANRGIRRDEADGFPTAVLGRKALEHVVGVGCVAHGERPHLTLLSPAVEDDHAFCPAARDEACKCVNELLVPRERARVEDVVPIE